MYTPPTNSSSIRLRLTPAMIDRSLNVQPYEIIVDVPLKYDTLPEDAQQKILEALAADASVNVEEVQQDTITVYAGISCDLRHNARSCPESRTAVALIGSMADDVCITAYAMTTPEAGEEPVSAIMDTAMHSISPMHGGKRHGTKEHPIHVRGQEVQHHRGNACRCGGERYPHS